MPLSQPSRLDSPQGVVPRGLADKPGRCEQRISEAPSWTAGEQSVFEKSVNQKAENVAPRGLGGLAGSS